MATTSGDALQSSGSAATSGSGSGPSFLGLPIQWDEAEWSKKCEVAARHVARDVGPFFLHDKKPIEVGRQTYLQALRRLEKKCDEKLQADYNFQRLQSSPPKSSSARSLPSNSPRR